ncbi:hypothetical protein JXJ21_04400 [candidate division KSB1 bacterium]|nr:hypothetical protein [candidate division KSB1 bacterium]
MPTVGKIAQILDESKFVINLGLKNKIQTGQEFIIYQEGDEIFDPDSKESLGKLEIPKGRLVVEHVQERISIAITKTIEQKSEHKTLSELMVDASVPVREEREKLNINRTDMQPQAKISPVKVGDWVRLAE